MKRQSVLPGFGPALGYTIFYLSIIVLIPLSALLFKSATLTWPEFVAAVASPRVLASYRVTFGAALLAAGVNALFGLLVAWVLVRYDFPGKRLLDALVDLPFALTLGASGLPTCFRVTLPNVKWGVLYGVILCNARAMGEFGAVSVVSGHVRGSTNTIPLQVEILYNEYNYAAAFAVASLLALLALVTLVVKSVAEWKVRQALQAD